MLHNLGTDPLSILIYCGAAALLFLIVGLAGLWAGIKRTKPAFRSKGYLRTPSGSRLFHFLLFKQYEAFDDSGIRFYFGVAHFCLVGMFVALAGFLALLGCELLLMRVSG